MSKRASFTSRWSAVNNEKLNALTFEFDVPKPMPMPMPMPMNAPGDNEAPLDRDSNEGHGG